MKDQCENCEIAKYKKAIEHIENNFSDILNYYSHRYSGPQIKAIKHVAGHVQSILMTHRVIDFDDIKRYDKMNFTELIQATIEWGNQRGLIQERNATRQMLKVTEEIGELAGSIAKNKREDTIDAIGDSFVTLIILSAQLGLDPAECLRQAYDEIADRKGETVDGVFIKS